MKRPPSKDILFVSIQICLFTIYFIPVLHYTIQANSLFRFFAMLFVITGIIVLFIAFMQLNKNLTPFPTPIESGTLIQSGLYKYIRHPIYSGFILTALGYGVFTGNLWKVIVGIALWVLFYFKSRYEESLLLKHYKCYREYIKRTKRFFPFV